MRRWREEPEHVCADVLVRVKYPTFDASHRYSYPVKPFQLARTDPVPRSDGSITSDFYTLDSSKINGLLI